MAKPRPRRAAARSARVARSARPRAPAVEPPPHPLPPALFRLEKRIRATIAQGRRGAWLVGTMVDEIASGSLHVQCGYERLEQYLEARFPDVGADSLLEHRRVAREFALESVVRFGTRKLARGLTYLELTPEAERPRDLLRLEIRVSDDSVVAFARASVRQLEAAIARLRASADAEGPSRGAQELEGELESELARGRAAEAPPPVVVVRRKPRGEGRGYVVSITRIDDEQLGRVGRALVRVAEKRRSAGG